MDIKTIRNEYKRSGLTKSEISESPFVQFKKWLEEALQSETPYPTAMSFSTVGTTGFPETRIVLLKYYDESGFVFFTNYNSEKSRAVEKNALAGLHFFWPELERQIRISGHAEKTSAKLSDEYFQSRPEMSQIAAWASDQSRVIPSREYLEEKFTEIHKKYQDKEIPRPEFWGGLKVKPVKMEFWQGRESRLHDRILYEKENDGWKIKRLAP